MNDLQDLYSSCKDETHVAERRIDDQVQPIL